MVLEATALKLTYAAEEKLPELKRTTGDADAAEGDGGGGGGGGGRGDDARAN